MRAYMPYVLLMCAASWHALSVGTQGLRGRIVHSITGAGILWGAVTPPWGWVQIGAAVATVVGLRWLITPEGRVFAVAAGRWLVQAADLVLITLGRTLRWVLSPRTHEGPPVELSEPVSVPRDTLGSRMATTPPAHLFEPEPWRRGTAQETTVIPVLTQVETYEDMVRKVAAGKIGWTEGCRLAVKYGVSRSTYARKVRALKEGKAA